ncbi:MAG: protease modulator HflC [Candidatus Sumerlaeia bacterium]|nr:protease modulator HflC [Candidatus Sumerlaeia bacterium]
MNKPSKAGLGLGALVPVIIAAAVLARASLFSLDESQQAIVVQFGEVVGETITEPGLHFKKPFVQEVRYFDKRLLAWDGFPNEVPTKGREFVFVDATARWRIVNPRLFLESVRDEKGAQSRLDDILDSAVRDEVSSLELVEIVRSTDWRVDPARLASEIALSDEESELFAPITVGREGLTQRIHERAAAETLSIGIELVDVRLKRLNYVESVRRKVYERMISERKRIAAQFRSEGEGRSAEIRGDTERQLQEVRSKAERDAEILRGRADAAAARIYADAYNAAPDFFALQRTLESYATSLTARSTVVLGTDSDYFRFLKSIGGEKAAKVAGDIPERIKRIEEYEKQAISQDLTEGLGEDLPEIESTGAGEP